MVDERTKPYKKIFVPRNVINMVFPQKCIYCCGEAADYREIEVREKPTTKSEDSIKLRIPYCKRCLKRSYLSRVLMVILLVASAVIASVGMAKDVGSDFDGNYLMVAILAGFAVGLGLWVFLIKHLIGIFVEFVRDTPVVPMRGAMGLKVWLYPRENMIVLRFANSNYGKLFLEHNPSAGTSWHQTDS